jgi:hypothetical protein
MIIRIIEQFLASGATFALSMVALRVLDPESLSVFFLLISGSQIAMVVLSARRISIFVKSSTRIGCNYLIGWSAIFDIVFASLAVTVISIILLYPSLESLRIDLGMASAVFFFSLTQLFAEWFRRAASVIFTQSVPPYLPALQLFRLMGPLLILLIPIDFSRNQNIFFGTLSVILLFISIAYLVAFKNIKSEFLVKCKNDQPTILAVAKMDKRAALEAYHILAWANIPIAVLTLVGGNAGISRLVEVRTPLSFFNPIIEYIEVHTRRITSEHLQYHELWLKVVIVFCFWLIISGFILIFGDEVASIIAGRPISGVVLDMIIFWWLQLLLVIDRITHNLERLKAVNKTHIVSTLVIFIMLLSVTIWLTILFGVAGCIVSMASWCAVNIIIRFHNRNC